MSVPANFSNSSDPWYVVQCKLNKEERAVCALRVLLGLTVFLPETKTCRGREVRNVSLFPGYFFVQVDLRKVERGRINSSPDVLRLVEFGGLPQAIPPSVMETIFDKINRYNNPDYRPAHGMQIGDLVRVKKGPLQELEMIFVGPHSASQRVRVLFEFLGGLKEVQIEAGRLEKITTPVSDRKRYTRGKGRHINQSAGNL